MSIKDLHKHRVEKIRSYVSANRLFLAMAALVTVLLLSGSFFFQKENEPSVEEEQVQSQETDTVSWRFYPIDGVILLVGGGFCVVQIIREKRKAKEELK